MGNHVSCSFDQCIHRHGPDYLCEELPQVSATEGEFEDLVSIDHEVESVQDWGLLASRHVYNYARIVEGPDCLGRDLVDRTYD
jgi:hypothetical protein